MTEEKSKEKTFNGISLVILFMFSVSGLGVILLSFFSKAFFPSFWIIERSIAVIIMILLGIILTVTIAPKDKNINNNPEFAECEILIYILAITLSIIEYKDFFFFLFTLCFYIGWSGISFFISMI